MVKVLNDAFGIEHGLMSTIHSYTNDQAILDQRHSDLRRARAAAMNIIPTNTGAARAVGLVLPELNGKLHGIAFRVPTSTGSATDFVATVSRDVSPEEVNQAYLEAANGALKGILEYTDEPLVSSDLRGNPHSCIFDSLSTIVMEGRMVKTLGWYDSSGAIPAARERVGLFLPHCRLVLPHERKRHLIQAFPGRRVNTARTRTMPYSCLPGPVPRSDPRVPGCPEAIAHV